MIRDPLTPGRSDSDTLDWLLQSDPAIRWQVLRDLSDAPPEVVVEERARVSAEGWGAELLRLQRADGQWGDGETLPFWWTNLYTLVWLRDLGVDPVDSRVKAAIDSVREQVTWGEWHGYAPFFDGESEPCINGRVVALGSYFGQAVGPVVDRLLAEQLADGGWNCEAERGSLRSSFHTTICVLEGLLEYERANGTDNAVSTARIRGEEYLLERRLLHRRSTGELIDPTWTSPTFPPLWHYDILRALDYFRWKGAEPDPRAEQGVRALRQAQRPTGRWSRAVHHRDTLYGWIAGVEGAESRWVTHRALRVLQWFAGSTPTG